jgi:hypothetical protein
MAIQNKGFEVSRTWAMLGRDEKCIKYYRKTEGKRSLGRHRWRHRYCDM